MPRVAPRSRRSSVASPKANVGLWSPSRSTAEERSGVCVGNGLNVTFRSIDAPMREAAVHAHPRETGGILLGVWTEGRPWVTHACELRSPDAGPAHYVLPAGATCNLVEQMQRIDSRVGYLGDWHTHPIDAAA